MATPIVNRANPRLMLHIDWGSDRPMGLMGLYVRRIGEPTDFAVYAPVDERGGEILFQFDELLFVRAQGVYEGRLMVGANQYAVVRFAYRDDVRVVYVGNPDYV